MVSRHGALGAACAWLAVLSAPLCRGEFVMEEPSPGNKGASPYHLLDPADFAAQLGDDFAWATGAEGGIPLFDASDAVLRAVYLFRWRTYKSHIHPTGREDIPLVVTEFAPNVPWAGKYNTINCAAGHHMVEAGWLRNTTTAASYSRWWVQPEARHNYYFWYATALRRNFARTGDVGLLQEVVPAYKALFMQYASGQLPSNYGGSDFSAEHDCLWNSPGNEGQEQSLSGPGCRTLVQSVMFGESSALADLCDAIGDAQGATEMRAEANRWQERVLRLWNPDIASFDTLRFAHPPTPPPPPPPPPAPIPPGWSLVAGHNGTFCCDQAPCVGGHSKFLFEGELAQEPCFAKCQADARCNFVTFANQGNPGYCMNAEFCNTTNPFAGAPTSVVHTYQKAHGRKRSSIPAAPPAPAALAGVRELASLSSPWFFGAVPAANASAYARSWLTAFDPDGLGGPYGLRTAERRAPGYFSGHGCCKWSGPMWPFETAKAVTAAINVLNNYPSVDTVNGTGFYDMLQKYALSHTPLWKVMNGTSSFYGNLSDSNVAQWLELGLGELWIAESGCADDTLTPGGLPGPAWTDSATEGYRYNHATFMDLVLSGVVGVQPGGDNTSVVVNPLAPAEVLPWWAADGVPALGRSLAVSFDADGSRFKNGTGLKVWVDGVLKASAPRLGRLVVPL